RSVTEIDLLLDGLFCLVLILIFLAGEAELCLQWNRVRKSLGDALFDGVLGSIEGIVNELEGIALAAILNGEMLLKDGLKTDVLSFFRRHVVLDEFPERFQLDIQKVRIVMNGVNTSEVFALSVRCLTVCVQHRLCSLRCLRTLSGREASREVDAIPQCTKDHSAVGVRDFSGTIQCLLPRPGSRSSMEVSEEGGVLFSHLDAGRLAT